MAHANDTSSSHVTHQLTKDFVPSNPFPNERACFRCFKGTGRASNSIAGLPGESSFNEVGTSSLGRRGAGWLAFTWFAHGKFRGRPYQQVDLGFNPANVVTMHLSLPDTRYAEPQKVRGFFNELVSRTERLPGVESVALVNSLPLKGTGMELNVYVEGQQENPGNVELLMSLQNTLMPSA